MSRTSDTVQWGILGCGAIAHKLAEAITKTKQCQITAVASRSAERASAFASKWGAPIALSSYEELVSHPDLDVIYIATPHSHHYAHTKLALSAGKNVLCEKAFTVNAQQLELLIQMAKDNGLFLMEAMWTRFLPGVEQAMELIHSGALGVVNALSADFGFYAPFKSDSRLFNPSLAGGALLDIGIYPLFLSLLLFGAPDKYWSDSVLSRDGIDLSTSMLLRHPGNIHSHLFATLTANTPTTATIYGSEGSLHFHEKWFTPVPFTIRGNQGAEQLFEIPATINGYEYEVDEVNNCILRGKMESDRMPLAKSLELLRMMDRIRKNNGVIYPNKIEIL